MLNYVYNTHGTSKKITGGQVLFFQWYAAKFTFLDAPRNTRCNAILKNILSLTNDQIPGYQRVEFCTRENCKKPSPPHTSTEPIDLSNASPDVECKHVASQAHCHNRRTKPCCLIPRESPR